jgi:hypothetical protein
MYNPWEKLVTFIMSLRQVDVREGLNFRGEIKLEFFDKYGRLINVIEDKNFIVDLGLETVIDILSNAASSYDGHKIFRMAIGDDGSLTGQPFVPKVPDATWPARTGLFYEVMRQNIGTVSQPTTTSMKFVTSFASADITPASFSSSPPVLNEASLIISDGSQSGAARDEIPQGYTPTSDEKMFSIRTFKSQAFDPADTLTLTISWTIFAQ